MHSGGVSRGGSAFNWATPSSYFFRYEMRGFSYIVVPVLKDNNGLLWLLVLIVFLFIGNHDRIGLAK